MISFMRFGHAEERREDGKGVKEKARQSLTYQKVAVHLVRDLVVAEHNCDPRPDDGRREHGVEPPVGRDAVLSTSKGEREGEGVRKARGVGKGGP